MTPRASSSTSPASLAPEGADASIRVWDLPTRLLHWAMAGLFAASFGLATLSSEHSPAFRWHMAAGLALVGAAALRVVWGFMGSRHARFRSFLCGPGTLLSYLADAARGRDKRQAGHNPGAAFAAMALLLLPFGLVATGLAMSGRKEAFEDLHQALAYGMLAAVMAHLAGLAFHAIRHRDRTPSSMVTGRKLGRPEEGIASVHPLPALAVLLLLGGWGSLLVRSFDAERGLLSLPGVAPIQLGEGGGHGPGQESEAEDDD